MHWREKLFVSGLGWTLYWSGFGVAALGSILATEASIQESSLWEHIGVDIWALGGLTSVAQLILMKHPSGIRPTPPC